MFAFLKSANAVYHGKNAAKPIQYSQSSPHYFPQYKDYLINPETGKQLIALPTAPQPSVNDAMQGDNLSSENGGPPEWVEEGPSSDDVVF